MRTAFLFVVILLAGCVDNPLGPPSPQRLSQWYQDEDAFVPICYLEEQCTQAWTGLYRAFSVRCVGKGLGVNPDNTIMHVQGRLFGSDLGYHDIVECMARKQPLPDGTTALLIQVRCISKECYWYHTHAVALEIKEETFRTIANYSPGGDMWPYRESWDESPKWSLPGSREYNEERGGIY